jgi:hypothetical protein
LELKLQKLKKKKSGKLKLMVKTRIVCMLLKTCMIYLIASIICKPIFTQFAACLNFKALIQRKSWGEAFLPNLKMK